MLFKKIATKIIQKLKNKWIKRRDLTFNTHIQRNVPFISYSYIDIDLLDTSGIPTNVAVYLSQMYCEHRFDLLGSGWVRQRYDSRPLGLEGYKYDMNVQIKDFDTEGIWLNEILLPAHLEYSRKIWQEVSDGYIPIDWQKDYKSGFRWNAQKWYKHQCIYKLGVDIKVPWELARMQQLPQMAIFAKMFPQRRKDLILEFKNQILDFIATNPPRMGVNWSCTMDVGIRVANMLVAYDLFCQLDADNIINRQFKQIFANSVYEHGLQIVSNLEWNEKLTSNHYLSDIAGLLYAAAYLECNEEVNNWLAFAIQEIIKEIRKQFNPDGSNFEASTSYHRLSGEIMVYCVALILGLDKNKKTALKDYTPTTRKQKLELKPFERQEYSLKNHVMFPEWLCNRLFLAGTYTHHLTKPTGQIAQIGDNDSGRFFRFSPNGKFLTNREAESRYLNLKGYNELIRSNENDFFWDENILNHSTFISALNALFDPGILSQHIKKFPLEYSIVKNLTKGKSFQLPIEKTDGNDYMIEESPKQVAPRFCKKTIIKPQVKSNISLLKNIKRYDYSDSGMYIFKSDRLYLAISAGPNGQNGNGGHAHNDKLSFELCIDGEDVTKDPGTYLYTPLPEMRNQFRSIRAHNTLIVERKEQNDWRQGRGGLFNMKNQCHVKIRDLKSNSVEIELKYKNVRQLRLFEILDDMIVINDHSNVKFTVSPYGPGFYSNGYGKLLCS